MIKSFSDVQLATLNRNPEFVKRGGVCPVCDGDQHYFYKGVRYDCLDDDYGHTMLRRAKANWLAFIPLEYQMLMWDEFPHNEAKEDVEAYLQGFRRLRMSGVGVTFTGGLGVGKTWAASHILRELVKEGYDSHFASFLLVKNYINLNDKERRGFLLDRVTTSEVLLLDEVTASPFSSRQQDYFEEQLEEIIRQRTNMNFPTIVTTNLAPTKFSEEYPRVYSLLAGKNLTITLEGEDARESGVVFDNNTILHLRGEARPIL